jgi:hypothetical protein
MRARRRRQSPESGKPLVVHAVDRQRNNGVTTGNDDRPPAAEFGETPFDRYPTWRAERARTPPTITVTHEAPFRVYSASSLDKTPDSGG